MHPTINLSVLKPNPFNAEIYDKITPESVADLADSIKNTGLLSPIEISDSHHIISGHRRVEAYRVLGIEKIPYKLKHFNTKEEEQEYIIAKNQYRVKTTEERIREGQHLKMLYEALGRGGRLNDSVAAAVGLSRRTFEKGTKAVEVMDELAEKDPAAAADIKAQLGKSVHAGYEASRAAFEEKFDSITNEAIEDAKVDQEAEERKARFFYLPMLNATISMMENTYAKIVAKKDSTFPTALAEFAEDIRRMASRLKTRTPEGMTPCTNCNGTKVTPEGNVCPECIAGKTGLFSSQKPRV